MIQRACRELATELHEKWGHLAPWEESTLAQISREVPLPIGVREWYRCAGPHHFRIPWSIESLELFGPDSLVTDQEGYRFAAGARSVMLATWDPEWLAIGSVGGDPIIVSAKQEGVSMAVHGVGSWSPRQVAFGLPEFLSLLTRWLRLWKAFSGELRDDDCELLPEVRSRLESDVVAPLSTTERAAFLGFFE